MIHKLIPSTSTLPFCPYFAWLSQCLLNSGHLKLDMLTLTVTATEKGKKNCKKISEWKQTNREEKIRAAVWWVGHEDVMMEFVQWTCIL